MTSTTKKLVNRLNNNSPLFNLLLDNLIAKISYCLHKEIEGIDEEARSSLLRHNYEGNIRELENVLWIVILNTKGKVIQKETLPRNFSEEGGQDEL